jgi:endonuclease/exonuclease/phosphatase family metal-dependent hydrolase
MQLPRILWGALGPLIAACSGPSSEPETAPPPPSELKVMSFNIWRSGGRSLVATTDAIRSSGADIIGLQECNEETAQTLARDLGVNEVHDENGHAILTRFPIAKVGSTRDVWGGLGATITVGRPELPRVHVFDAHLFWDEYGPYYLREGKSSSFVIERENARRMPGLAELFALMDPFVASADATLLVGDFNAPSHLDYVDFAWPESIACLDRGLADSYRELHPQNRKYPGAFALDEPGITWTPLSSEEPHGAFDRIDFIYYRSSRGLVPTSSTELDERNSVKPWPSDHRAVLTTFASPTR